MKDRIASYIVGTVACLISLWIGLRDYARIEDYYLYRLILNFAQGHGIVYNPDEAVMPTVGPFMVIPAGLLLRLIGSIEYFSPAFIPYVVDVLLAIGYGLAAALLYYRLRRSQLTSIESAWVISIWLMSWPTWASWHAPSPYTLIFILLSLHYWERDNYRMAGFIAGMAVLVQPEGALACIALGAAVHLRHRRFWQTAWIPATVWGFIALLSYPDGILLEPVLTRGDSTLNLLWLGLGLGAVWIMRRTNPPRWWWLFPLWAALETGSRSLIAQDLILIQSLPLTLTIGLALIWGSRRWQISMWRKGSRGVAFAGIALFTLLSPPQTDTDLAQDIALSQTLYIPEGRTLLHDRSDGITAAMIDFDDALYGLDGKRSPVVGSFIKRHDYASLIVALAPDYIYYNNGDGPLAGYNLRDPEFKALGYRKELDVMLDAGQREGDQLWIRYGSITDFMPKQTVNFDFNTDLRLASYATDQPRVDEALRIRLEWELKAPLATPLTIHLTLADTSLTQLAHAEYWDVGAVTTTYHVLTLPNTPFSLEIAVEEQGRILNTVTIGG